MTAESWDLEVDLVGAGSGLGGLTAAIVAHDLGRSVVVLEKAPVLGGVSAYSLAQVFVPCNHKQAAAGVTDSPAAARQYLEFLAAGFADEELMERLIEVGPEAVRYLEEQANVPWQIIDDLPDYHYPHVEGTLASGRYLEVEPIQAAELGEWAPRIAACPIAPPGSKRRSVSTACPGDGVFGGATR